MARNTWSHTTCSKSGVDEYIPIMSAGQGLLGKNLGARGEEFPSPLRFDRPDGAITLPVLAFDGLSSEIAQVKSTTRQGNAAGQGSHQQPQTVRLTTRGRQ